LITNRTWAGSKWVFPVRYTVSRVQRFKARMVTRGFFQAHGIEHSMHSHQQCEQILREVLLTLLSSPLETMERTEQISTALGLSPWHDGSAQGNHETPIQVSSIKLLTKVLKKMGFEPMPSVPCVVMHNQAHRTQSLRQRLMLPRRSWVSSKNSSGISPRIQDQGLGGDIWESPRNQNHSGPRLRVNEKSIWIRIQLTSKR
jgi:hypothetical protein